MPLGVKQGMGRSDRGRETRWPTWLGLSGLLHALLLAGLVVVPIFHAPPGERPAPSVRVRLENDPPAVPAPVPPPEPPLQKVARPAPRRSPPRPAPARAAQPPTPPREELGALASPEAPAAPVTLAPPSPREEAGSAAPPDAQRVAAAATPPARVEREGPDPRGQGGPDGAPPLGPVGEGPTRASMLQPGRPDLPVGVAEGWNPTRTDEAGSVRARQGAVAGLFVITDAGGSGTGERGRGASDQGIGTGGGGTGSGGHGAAGSGPGGLGGGSGSGGGGDRLASRSPGSGTGPGGGLTDLLQVIRRRIEQAQTYPDDARRAGMQGTVEVRFRIGPDGSADAVEIVRSSGHPVLDEASLQTVRRAGPYPVVPGRIRIPLSYRLGQ